MIFMDLQMPVMDGIEATRKILRYSNRNSNKKNNIIALTAYVTSIEKQKCLDNGMQEVLRKPININILRTAIQKYYV
jgi:CheY-like chemotaxis protein